MNGQWILGLGLTVGLTLPGVMPEVANVAFFVGAAIALVVFLVSGWRDASHLGFAPLVPLLSGLVLATAFMCATGSAGAAIYAGYFLPLYLLAPLATFIRTAGDGVSPAHIAIFAALGCIAALSVASFDAFVLALPGPGTSVNNPIHFADLVLTLAFVSLAGLYDGRPSIRAVAIVGWLVGLLAVLLSGARGPMLALPPMALIGLFVMIWQRTPASKRLVLTLGALTLGVVAAVVVWKMRLLDHVSAFSDAALFLRDGTIVDHSTWERITMYEGAWNAWRESPVFGYGMADVVSAARRTFALTDEFPTYEHLHSDIANFAVAGGTVGLLAYLGFLVAPVLTVSRSGHGQRQHAGQFLAITVATGYLFMGLTNTMFGILSQTALYAVVSVLAIHLSRR